MKRSIFISRDLPENSSLLQFLLANNWDVHHQSLIRITPLQFSIELEADWIFVSSSNGAKILFNSFRPLPKTKIGVVGKATAAAVRFYGIEPAFIGQTGDMNAVALELANTVGANSILFVGAEGGSEIIRSAIPSNQISFVPIYRTEILEKVVIPETDVVFLSSPSNAKCYMNNASLDDKTVIAIGSTTASFLQENRVTEVLIPHSPSEESVIDLLRKL